MNRPRLSKSGIEYLTHSWGIFSGCHNHLVGICGGEGKDFNCWAQSIAYRFPNLYPYGFNPHYYPEAIDSPKYLKKPARIGVGWVGDIIGYGLEYKEQIYSTIRACPQHTFLFLTKNPEELLRWSPFPRNVWIGATVTNQEMHNRAIACLSGLKALVKFISYEPLLNEINFNGAYDLSEIQWVVLGQCTPVKKATMPNIEWIIKIVEATSKANIPVFLKNNLYCLIPRENIYAKLLRTPNGSLRQEFPK